MQLGQSKTHQYQTDIITDVGKYPPVRLNVVLLFPGKKKNGGSNSDRKQDVGYDVYIIEGGIAASDEYLFQRRNTEQGFADPNSKCIAYPAVKRYDVPPKGQVIKWIREYVQEEIGN